VGALPKKALQQEVVGKPRKRWKDVVQEDYYVTWNASMENNGQGYTILESTHREGKGSIWAIENRKLILKITNTDSNSRSSEQYNVCGKDRAF
jgi:hypothetical protein